MYDVVFTQAMLSASTPLPRTSLLTTMWHSAVQNVNVDKLTESIAQMRDKIGTEVFGPMSEWNRDYKKVQVSNLLGYISIYD